MSERWGDSQRDRNALDRWLTRDYDDNDNRLEYEAVCGGCGKGYSDHDQVQRTDDNGNDYETYVCRQQEQPETGSTFAKDNDPAFQEVAIPGYSVFVERPRTCSFNCQVEARYDGKTTFGSWADMCQQHFDEFGVGLGVGRGQKLLYRQ